MIESPPSLEREAEPTSTLLPRVPLVVDGHRPTAVRQPFTVGIPFPRGVLASAESLALLAGEQRSLPLQATALAHWSDGSIRWLLIDSLLPSHPTDSLCLVPAEAAKNCGAGRGELDIHEGAEELVVATGAATFHVNTKRLQPLAQVSINGEELLDGGRSRIILLDARDGQGIPSVTAASVEARGPVRATVRLDGAFTGRVPARFTARLDFFAGLGLVRLRLTVHNPRRARHRGGLWDLGDPGSLFFRDLSLELGLGGHSAPRIHWAAEVGEAPSVTTGDVEIYQDSSGGENWRSRNHVNHKGIVPCSFRGYRVRVGGEERSGLRARPLLALEGDRGAISAGVPEFWQQFPKAVEADGPVLRVRLFPGQFGDLFELQGGEQKTHTIWLHYGPARTADVRGLAWVHQPARVHALPQWYESSGAIPHLVASDSSAMDSYLAGAVAGPDSFFAGREVIDEYGWRHFGDVYADHEALYYKGPPPVVSHYNNQYDVVYGTILQYLRAGDPRWVDLWDPLARHVIDIDLYHTEHDRAAYNGGLFWHTDHYRDAATCTHRAYSRANQPPGAAYGGGPCNEHNYTTGLLHYYYLTGDPSAREAVLSLADWVVRMDDGRRTVFGLLDSGPTGLASATTERDYHGPGRGCGNSVNALLDGWLLSRRQCYLEKAWELIRRCLHPDDDPARRGLLDVERRWSYTVFLSVLGRFLDLYREYGEPDARYAYARASLLRYAAWMAEHEEPYFAHPEKLEYPTETWAAQEYRKANVLRLAAAQADEPLGGRLLGRADELADRAWDDLHRCSPAATARARAILFVEGMRDRYFHLRGVRVALASTAVTAFGQPACFVLQRRCVLSLLRSPQGWLRAACRLLSPGYWLSLLGRRRNLGAGEQAC
jgi:hypothetical protein